MELPKSLAILREACVQNGVRFELLDSFSGFVARISNAGQTYLVGAAGIGVYPLNRAAPFGIARDKAFTHYVLRQAGFHVPDGGHFFLKPRDNYQRPAGRDHADALGFAEKFSDGFRLPLVVKPNSGKGAKRVEFVRSKSRFAAALHAISEIDDIAMVQAFLDQPEYRLFLVDGEIAFAYRKARPVIEGDGETSIRTLWAAAMDPSNGMDASPPPSEYLSAELAVRGLAFDSPLGKGEIVPIDFISNISAGGRFAGLLEPTTSLRDWSKALAKTVSLRVTGVDVFSNSGLADTDDIIITDVNGSPNLGTLYDLGLKDLVFRVWRDILRKTFSEAWPEGF